ncbi:MAG: hypothetical protein ABGX16_25465 [Pirellulales bacterium]|jgi:hypothetical protein
MDEIKQTRAAGPTPLQRWVAAAILGIFIMVGFWGHAWFSPEPARYQTVVVPKEDGYYIMDNQTGKLFGQRGVHLMDNNRLRFIEYPASVPMNAIKAPIKRIRPGE